MSPIPILRRALPCLALILALAPAGATQCRSTEDFLLTDANGSSMDAFGASVDLDGSVAIVGAPLADPGGLANAGTATVMRFDGTQWQAEQTLSASTPGAQDRFGWDVAIDGNVAVVGAIRDDDGGSNAGVAFFFRFNGTTWNEERMVAGSVVNGRVGFSVDVDNDTVVIGEPGGDGASTGSGAAHVYEYDGAQWNGTKIQASNGASGDAFGLFVAASGSAVVVGAPGDDDGGSDAGSVFVYRRSGTSWMEEQQLIPAALSADDELSTVAISGNVIVAGAVEDDVPGVGTDTGSAYVFRHDGSQWQVEQQLFARDGVSFDYFGHAVAVDADRILVTANDDDDTGLDSGSVYQFRHDGTRWLEVQKLNASNGAADDGFGNILAVSGDVLLAGGPGADGITAESGAAYAFHVADLSLDSNLDTAPPGSNLSLTTCGGLDGGLVSIYVVDVNGAPQFIRLALGSFDPLGEWSFGGPVPGGLSGLVVKFLSLGFYQPSTIGLSNQVTVSFQ